MQTRLILIRHGDSHHKVDRVVGGPHGCRGLTDAGRVQAGALARRLVRELDKPPAAIYSSVLPRAVESAKIVSAAFAHVDVVSICGLCTWHTPAHADGKLWTEYRREHGVVGGGVFRPFERDNETWSGLVARTGQSLEEISARHIGESVIVVAHAETITSSLIVFGGVPLVLGFDLKILPTSITEWTTTGDPEAWPRPRWTLVRLNDSAHLSQPFVEPDPA